uniref:Uncharacterized protein n=1 Tax=Rhizophora mucronata TaxID=61149 RepID=A0A2P2QKW3_RHIMU
MFHFCPIFVPYCTSFCRLIKLLQPSGWQAVCLGCVTWK